MAITNYKPVLRKKKSYGYYANKSLNLGTYVIKLEGIVYNYGEIAFIRKAMCIVMIRLIYIFRKII